MGTKNGYIYILTNNSFHKSDLVKIGWAADVEKRVKELSNTSVPEPFEIYATYEVPFDSKMPDKALHKLIQKLNPSLRITQNREFFEIEPWDAYEILHSMAIIHNREDKLVRYKDNNYGVGMDEDSQESYSIEKLFPEGSEERNLFEQIASPVLSKYPHVRACPTKLYVAFKKDKKHNLIAIWPKNGWIEIVLCAKQGSIDDEDELTYDISNRQWPAAQYALRFDDNTDINQVLKLIDQIK